MTFRHNTQNVTPQIFKTFMFRNNEENVTIRNTTNIQDRHFFLLVYHN